MMQRRKSNMELPYGVWKNTKVEFILIRPTLVSEWRWNSEDQDPS